MRFRINTRSKQSGHRKIIDIILKKGCMYLTCPYISLREGEYFLASHVLVPPNAQLPASVSLGQGLYYHCAKAPKLSIKPNGQCHIRANNGVALWGLNTNKLIPITKYHERHIFTVGVNWPTVFVEHDGKVPKNTHDIHLEMPDPKDWEHFRIVGYVHNPAEVKDMNLNDPTGSRKMNASQLIPSAVGVSAPLLVLKQGEQPEQSLWIGINPGSEWPLPFILELVIRKWINFEPKEDYRGGIIIMGGFDAEAKTQDSMEMLTILAPVKATRWQAIKTRTRSVLTQINYVLKQARKNI